MYIDLSAYHLKPSTRYFSAQKARLHMQSSLWLCIPLEAMDDDVWLSQDLEGTDTSLSHPFISHYNPSGRLCIHHCLLLANKESLLLALLPYKMT